MSDMSPIGVFISYSHNDEVLRDQLAKHLKILQREGIIETWYDREIGPGLEWDEQIKQNLVKARIILLLISADFIASDYIWDVEVENAMVRHEAEKCRVIPVILKPCDWESAPFGKLQALPKGAEPISVWENQDDAFKEITRSIREIAIDLGGSPLPGDNALMRIIAALFRHKSKWMVSFFMLFLVLFIHGLAAPGIADSLMENARFTNAVRYLRMARLTAFFNPEIPRILKRLQTPLPLHVSLIVQRAGKPFPDRPYPLDPTGNNPIAVSPKDGFKLRVETIPGRFFLYLYATSKDNSSIKRLFPSENSPKQAVLVENQALVEIPRSEERWVEIQRSSEPITLHLLATPWRATDIETVYKAINTPPKLEKMSREEQKIIANRLVEKILFRKNADLNCFYHVHLSFRLKN